MMQRLRMSALTLVLTGFTAIAAIGLLLPWERGIFNSTSRGVDTVAGLWVLMLVIVVAGLAVLRLLEYTLPHALEAPLLGVAFLALAIMLLFYVTQIGRADNSVGDATFRFEVARGYFVTLAGLLALEVAVAAHRFEVPSWLWTDTRYVDADA